MSTGPPPIYTEKENGPLPVFPEPPGPNEAPPGYTQTSHYSQNFVVVNQPGMMRCQSFLETPVRTTCPSCRAEILTSTHYETGTFTWVACLVIAFVGLWLFCCLIPFCMNACKDVVHTCPSCRHTVGRFSRA
ncbi:LITAF domain-containing protein-like [Mytilus trossulus]|uniref:LITAF domain-containing protein-like n=1 Tax=Mytilus trossulus TaxID=6551 RepID=UPI003007D2BE